MSTSNQSWVLPEHRSRTSMCIAVKGLHLRPRFDEVKSGKNDGNIAFETDFFHLICNCVPALDLRFSATRRHSRNIIRGTHGNSYAWLRFLKQFDVTTVSSGVKHVIIYARTI